MEGKVIRQGDLLFVPIDKIGEYVLENKRTDGIVARGEATGHHHQLAVLEAAELYAVGESRFLAVGPEGVSITHEEHAPVELQPNTNYEVHQAREFDYLAGLDRRASD
jgi:hypothetical protein